MTLDPFNAVHNYAHLLFDCDCTPADLWWNTWREVWRDIAYFFELARDKRADPNDPYSVWR